MICPRWVAVKAQSIAVEDVVAYLMAALMLPQNSAEFSKLVAPTKLATAKSCRSMPGNAASTDG